MKKAMLIIVYALFYLNFAVAQDHVAPTLQLGLNGFSYSKGILDHELIIEIIAEKQEEVKERLVKSMLLSKIDNAGATIYGFVDNTIDVLRNTKDSEIRTRAIVENSINLAIIGSFTEYFLNKHKAHPEIAKAYNYFNSGVADLTTAVKVMNKMNRVEDISFPKDSVYRNKNNEKTEGLFTSSAFNNNNIRLQDYNKSTKFISYFTDMAAIEIGNNQELKRLGVYKNSYTNQYQSLNSFTKHASEIPENSQNLALLMRKELSDIMAYAGILAYLDNINHVHIGGLSDWKLTLNNFTLPPGTTIKTNLEKLVDDLKIGMKKVTKGATTLANLTSKTDQYSLVSHADFDFYKTRIEIINNFLYRVQMINLENAKIKPAIVGDLLFEIMEKVRPAVNDLLAHSPDMMEFSIGITELSQFLLTKIKVDNTVLTDEFFKVSFATTVSKLYQFDEAETYEQLFTILLDIGKMFKNEAIYSVVQTITSLTNTHMKFIKGKDETEQIEFDVEGILTSIQSKSYNKHRPLEFSFTVGSNTAIFDTPFKVGEESLNSIAFVSEKIGLKCKIFDWQYRYSFNKGETFSYWGKEYKRLKSKIDPMMDNIHILAYGSGLLYNITNLTTGDGFNYPIFGVGLGLTFYNGLDLNFSVAKPMIFNSADKELNPNVWMYNIGFDIQFIEYSQRLNKKRKLQKQQKIKTELYNDLKLEMKSADQ